MGFLINPYVFSAVDLPHFDETILLVNSENVTSHVYDDSYGSRTITGVGAVLSSAETKFGVGSIFLDGVNDRCTLANTLAWLPQGPYTWEAWVYPLVAGAGTIMSWYQNSGAENSWWFRLAGTEQVQFLHVDAAHSTLTPATSAVGTVPANQWTHVAACFDGVDKIRVFTNGVMSADVATIPDPFQTVNSLFRIGNAFTGGAEASFFSGYIEEVRLTKGAARYASSFSPPTVRFPRPPARTELAVNFTGTNGSTTFTDISGLGKTLTAVGNAQIQSNKLELDGSGDYVSSPDSNDWTLTGSDFTLEVFGVIFDAVTGNRTLLSHYESVGSQRGWFWDRDGTAGVLRYLGYSTGVSADTSVTFSWTPTIGQAYDLACVKHGGSMYFYIDGVKVATGTHNLRIFDSTAALRIGALNNVSYVDGRIAAVRITSKEALYTGATYTVPTLPLT